MSDPLSDLAPFLQQARKSKPEFSPPDYLTVRLMRTRGSALEPPVAPVPEEAPLPRQFGPYMLEKILGQGGAGTVYEAYDAELERMIALKVLSPTISRSQESAMRFLREARAMAKLSDDHLMPLLAVHQETPSPCYTMPLMEGETLEHRILRKGPLSVEEAVALAKQLCAGLMVAHEADLVHRDLKPSNIFLEETESGPRARLMDFGLVKASEDPSMTREGEITGTPSFMAPEQIDGLPLDGRADLYALGATLFMALTGKPPFEGETLTSTLQQVSANNAPNLSEILPTVPLWFSVLVADLLNKEPAKRPASARLVQVRLREEKYTATATGERIQSKWLIGAFVTAGILGVLLWFSSQRMTEKTREVTFDLAQAVSDFESGDSWQIPAGVHYLESFDLKGGNLRMEGAAEGSRLVFVNLTGPAFRNAGDLELVNLTIDCSRHGEGESAPLVEAQGQSIKLINCRIEQKQSSNQFPDNKTLIEAPAGSETLFRGCEFYTFQSITWRMRGDARLTVEDSLIVSPGLVYSGTGEESAGGVMVRQSTCIHQIGFSHFVATDGRPKVKYSLRESLFECSHALLWLPLGDEEILDANVDYSANKALLLMVRKMVNSSPRPRIANRRPGTIDVWGPEMWADFWEEQQQTVTVKRESLIDRAEMQNRVIEGFRATQLAIPSGFQEWGADLEKVGPSRRVLK